MQLSDLLELVTFVRDHMIFHLVCLKIFISDHEITSIITVVNAMKKKNIFLFVDTNDEAELSEKKMMIKMTKDLSNG